MQASMTMWNGRMASQRPLILVLALAALFAAMRFAGMLGPTSTRWMLPLGFVLMMATPWVLLNREGREHIGLREARISAHAGAVLFGVVAALACFAIGFVLFGRTGDNWFVSVASYYRNSFDTTPLTAAQLYLIFTIPAVLFSPAGEEIFFRGVLQKTLEEKFSVNASTSIECALFGIVHLCHHGLVWGSAGLAIRPLSAALWVLLMFSVAWLFAMIRKSSGSLFPAMAAHAAFNIVMNTAVFAALW